MAIYNHLMKLGYDSAGSKSIDDKIRNLAGEYINKDKATSVFEHSFPTYVNTLFSNVQLDTFIRTVRKDSFKPREYELQSELGWSTSDFDMLRQEGELSEGEIRDFLDERDKFTKDTKNRRELYALKLLNAGYYYDILTRIAYRRPKEVNPDFKEQPIRIISTPMGGQGGWRMKMKRR